MKLKFGSTFLKVDEVEVDVLFCSVDEVEMVEGLLLPAAATGRILGCGAIDGDLDGAVAGRGAGRWMAGGVGVWHSATVFSISFQLSLQLSFQLSLQLSLH